MGQHGQVSEFGALLRQHRIAARLTQEQLASLAQLSSRTVGDLERGRVRRPQPPSVRLLADALGLTDAERDRFEQAAHAEYWVGRLQGDERGVLAGIGSGAVALAQLPPDVAGFTGRSVELAGLEALIADGPEQPTISVIVGAAGVGKTTLAVHWAHGARDRFPDGQLFANLRGFAATPPSRPIDVLTRFLHALGVPAEQVPMDAEEATSLYRSLLADRRMLVVLDNAAEPDQIRPLLPGGPHCRVLATSRDDLAGLVARDGARRLVLQVLAAPESYGLLARLLGAERAAAEPQHLAELAHLCAHLPLALRIAAANLDRGGYPTVSDYLVELRSEDRLAAFAVDGDPQAAVRAAFDVSYAKLPQPARRLFRLLGLVPGPDITMDAAAALLDATVEETRRLLKWLAGAHLLERAAGVEHRFTCHDLLREYARERARAQESAAQRRAATARLFGHYLHVAAAAARILDPDKLRLPLPDLTKCRCAVPAFTDGVQALSWLDAEHANLVAAITHAAAHGPRSMAWLLADSLRGYDRRRMHAVDWQTVALSALAAAEADNEPRAQVMARLSLGLLHVRAGSYVEALDQYDRALVLARRIDWLEAQAAALVNIGAAYSDMGQLADSADRLGSALAILRTIGPATQPAAAMNNLGLTLTHLGRPVEAADHYLQAIELYRRLGNRTGTAIALANLAALCHDTGRTEEALAHLREALGLCSGTQDQLLQALALSTLAEVRCDAGHHGLALEAAKTALATARDLGAPRFEAAALYQVARTHEWMGELKPAVEQYREALLLACGSNDRLPELDVRIGLANAGRQLGALDEATGHAEQALALAQRYGYRMREGRARTVLAALHLDAGDIDRAIDEATRAAAIQRETGHRRGEADALVLLDDAFSRRTEPPQYPAGSGR
jgi:tetratricopeptide (TPR) repeat protein/transcriptional regulator with XRE-family HTH domain